MTETLKAKLQMTKKQLADVKERYAKFIAAYKLKNGNKVALYTCPSCKKQIETIKPKANQTGDNGCWDSAKLCPECGEIAWVKVWPNGKTEVVELT